MRIAGLLKKSLSSEFLSVRPGASRNELTYIEGWVAVELANGIFGFDGWSSEIRDIKEEYCNTVDGKTSVAYSCVCRVTLKNGVYREDIGFGSAENQKQKNSAVEKAKKTASTDALKRALRLFGRALGNCLYDRKYLNEYRRKTTNGESLTRMDLINQDRDIFEKGQEDSSMTFTPEGDHSQDISN